MKIVGILFCVLVCSSCRPGGDRNTADKYLNQADGLYLKGDYRSALLALDRAQRADNSNYLVYEMRAYTLDKMDTREDPGPLILSNLNMAIHLAPQCASSSYHLRGVMALKQRDMQNALKDLTTAIEMAPTDPKTRQSYIRRATVYGALSNYDKAIDDATRAIELNPQEVKAFVIRAAAYNAISNRAEAIRNLEIALQLAPTDNIVLSLKNELGLE